MDKCLVTKLGNTVSGNFPKLGELIINVSTVGNDCSEPFASVGSEVELRGDLYFSDDSQSYDGVYLNRKTFKAEGEGQIVIKNKYGLSSWSFGTTGKCFNVPSSPIPLKDITYNSAFYSITGGGKDGYLAGDIECFEGKALTYARVEKNSGITGDIIHLWASLFKAMKGYKPGGTPPSSYTPVKLNNVNFSSTNISGTIEALVAKLRQEGVLTSGDLHHSITCYNAKVKFNGDYIATTGTASLDWTETTITYNGETITDVNNNA